MKPIVNAYGQTFQEYVLDWVNQGGRKVSTNTLHSYFVRDIPIYRALKMEGV